MDRPDDDVAIDVLCEAIIERYHASLKQSIAKVREDVAALVSSPLIEVIRIEFAALADLIHSHLAKEENLLFPAFSDLATATRAAPLPFVTVLHPIRVMEAEHVRIETALDNLRELAREVEAPDSVSSGFRRCMASLAALDAELRAHHRMENEVLFPKALELERRLF